MPLYLVESYKEVTIVKITGNDEIRMHLMSLGFNVGEKVTVLQKVHDNIIVKIKGISMAIGKDLAKSIWV